MGLFSKDSGPEVELDLEIQEPVYESTADMEPQELPWDQGGGPRWNRREFIRNSALAVAAGTAASAPKWVPPVVKAAGELLNPPRADILGMYKSEAALTFDGAMRVAAELDNCYAKVEPIAPSIPETEEALRAAALYIGPFFHEEGILAPDCEDAEVCNDPGIIFPADFGFELFQDGDDNFHVAGRVRSCQYPYLPDTLAMNGQYANQFAPMHREDVGQYGTLTHEWGHVTGICPQSEMGLLEMVSIADEVLTPAGREQLGSYIQQVLAALPPEGQYQLMGQLNGAMMLDPVSKQQMLEKYVKDSRRMAEEVPIMEATNEVATAEVLAAQVRSGSPYAVPAFIEHMRGFATQYALGKALSSGVESGQLAQYVEARMKTKKNAFERARLERGLSQVAAEPERYARQFERYGGLPYLLIREALNDPELKTQELKHVPNPSHRIIMDDVEAVLRDLPELATDYEQLVTEWELLEENP